MSSLRGRPLAGVALFPSRGSLAALQIVDRVLEIRSAVVPSYFPLYCS